jgi:hypothetical protein
MSVRLLTALRVKKIRCLEPQEDCGFVASFSPYTYTSDIRVHVFGYSDVA